MNLIQISMFPSLWQNQQETRRPWRGLSEWVWLTQTNIKSVLLQTHFQILIWKLWLIIWGTKQNCQIAQQGNWEGRGRGKGVKWAYWIVSSDKLLCLVCFAEFTSLSNYAQRLSDLSASQIFMCARAREITRKIHTWPDCKENLITWVSAGLMNLTFKDMSNV